MKENLEKANQALLEGDRDGVLRLLKSEPETADVLWLRAHSAASEEQRHDLLSMLVNGDAPYARLAADILEREKQSADKLSEPPDYQFWKQPTWAKRFEKMRSYGIWIFGAGLLLVVILFGAMLNASAESKFQQSVAVVQATQTASALYNQTVATYSSGTLSVLGVPEDPTTRLVTRGETQNDQFVPVAPALGARFVAIQLSFLCNIPICETPPQSTVNLMLTNEKIVSYDTSTRPFLAEQSALPRISQGKFTSIWFVFEVPINSSPKTLVIIPQSISGEQEVPQYLVWPIR